jgi:hypothetical protein
LEPKVWVESITFSDDTTIAIAKDDVVVIVGPNNSGKSATLRAIRDKFAIPLTPSPVVKKMTLDRVGTTDDLLDWLRSTTKEVEGSQNVAPSFQSLGNNVPIASASAWWSNAAGPLNFLAKFFCRLLSADERLQAANPPANIAITRDPPIHPIHFLLRNDSLEEKLSSQFKRAFGLDIVVHRNAGNQVPIYVGSKPQPKPGQDRVSFDYIQELEKLTPIQAQGDGMRSFLGILLFTTVGNEPVMLVDEPEAFLHPPQARHLGNFLVSEGGSYQQLFVATHSGDVLRGLLSSSSSRVRVLRLRRSGDVNITRQLDNTQIARVWGDPLLRYSNILDGLFHERVVVCESDADCRFYSAIMDAIFDAGPEDKRKPDIMFTHCGGKDRLPLVIRSLRELEVPISVVTDFDVLNNEQPLRNILEASRGNWTSILADWQQVKSAVDGMKPELATDEVKKELVAVLAGASGPVFPSNAKKQIQAILRRSSPWSTAKSVGTQFLPSGQPNQACTRLLNTLEASGVFVVPVGELEGFAKSVGGHGPAWVAEVLKQNLASSPELVQARQFVSKIIS